MSLGELIFNGTNGVSLKFDVLRFIVLYLPPREMFSKDSFKEPLID
jgi:hypothetical protein